LKYFSLHLFEKPSGIYMKPKFFYMFWSFVELVMNTSSWNGIVLYLYDLVMLPIFFHLHTCYAIVWIVEVGMESWLCSPFFFFLHTCYVLVCLFMLPIFFLLHICYALVCFGYAPFFLFYAFVMYLYVLVMLPIFFPFTLVMYLY